MITRLLTVNPSLFTYNVQHQKKSAPLKVNDQFIAMMVSPQSLVGFDLSIVSQVCLGSVYCQSNYVGLLEVSLSVSFTSRIKLFVRCRQLLTSVLRGAFLIVSVPAFQSQWLKRVCMVGSCGNASHLYYTISLSIDLKLFYC